MLPILQIGPLALQFPGLILLIGLWLGLSLAERYAARFQTQPGHLYNLVIGSLIGAVIGARLIYVLRYTDIFLANPASLVSLNPGLLDGSGAVIGSLLFALVYGQRKHLPFWRSLDALAPALAVLGIAWHLSNLASGSGFGSPTNLPWSIDLWGAQRHPVQLYEALAAGSILFLLWPGKTNLPAQPPGSYFLTLLALSAASRIIFEAFHGDSPLLPGGFRAVQILCWGILAGSLWLLWKKQQAHDPVASQETSLH